MKSLFQFLVLWIVLSSCGKKEHDPILPAEVTAPVIKNEDPDWITLEIPGGREAYAIAGDLDKTLLVTTWTKAFYTTDQGKTWQESKNFDGPIPGLLIRNDTTFALRLRRWGTEGKLLGAWDPLYFSPDYGKSWIFYFQQYKEYLDDLLPIGTVADKSGVSYSIQSNTTPVDKTTAFINPSELVKNDSLGTHLLKFPFKRSLSNLYLDKNRRLYVAASGGTYQPESNTFYCCTPEMPAVVYVSRKALP